MSVLGDSIRYHTAALNSTAAQVDALGSGGSAPVWPAATNLIGGTEPTPPSIQIAGASDSRAVDLTYYDRLCGSMPDGSVVLLGDSLIQAMPVCAASPFGINLGYGGRSTRRLLHHMTNTAHKAAFARAGAGVLLTGAVDCGNTAYYGLATSTWPTALLMIDSHIKNWITGP